MVPHASLWVFHSVASNCLVSIEKSIVCPAPAISIMCASKTGTAAPMDSQLLLRRVSIPFQKAGEFGCENWTVLPLITGVRVNIGLSLCV